jgi:ABC-type multidrug transport system ATPase subunit
MYDDLSAQENLAFAAEMQGRQVVASEIDAVLDRVGLRQVAHERLRTFSSGMQRRLALGRILLQAPRLLLLDEPYNSFDREGVALVNEVVREVVHRHGGTALIVLHDRQSAGGLLDRIVTLHAGKVAGEPDRAATDGSRAVLAAEVGS